MGTLYYADKLASDDKYQCQWWAPGLVGARPLKENKGADKGVDGEILFRENPKDPKPQQVIFSVEGGGTGVKDIRDLRSVITRDKAAIGALITMNEPTKPMRLEAAEASFFSSSVWHKQYPRQQSTLWQNSLAAPKSNAPPLWHSMKPTSALLRHKLGRTNNPTWDFDATYNGFHSH